MPTHPDVPRVPLSLTHLVQPPVQNASTGLDPTARLQRPPLLLLLHGVGSNENDLMGLASYLDPRFLILSARSPRTLSPGAYGWYPVVFTPQGTTGDTRDIKNSREILVRFIHEAVEAYNADPEQVYLMGFSQGAIMSLYVALSHPELIAGAVLMSGRMLEESWEERTDDDKLEGLPLLMVHGTRDTVLTVDGAREARKKLETLPVDLTYEEFNMAHEVSGDSLNLVVEWLRTQLDKAGK